MVKNNFDRTIIDLKKWINHTKEGSKRSEDSLVYYDILWNSLSEMINSLNHKDKLSDEEQDIIQMIKYTGTLFRVHTKFDASKDTFGIKETPHYHSWTKTNELSEIYWLDKGSNYLVITARTDSQLFGIDLIGIQNFIQKYYASEFSLGSPAIQREQEVVFPIQFSHIKEIKIKKI